jgi:putative (di)nucleoside polyphosphate hydrolase
MKKSEFFRANVGAIIINSQGKVLAFERSNIKGAWQFPQGGVDKGENLFEAIQREVQEETGIQIEKELRFLQEYDKWTVYELPAEMRRKRTGRGQVQRWFLFQVVDDDLQIDLEKAEDKEFADWKWMDMEELVEVVVDFRQGVYRELGEWLGKR